MDIQPITYHGRTVAACTAQRVFLSDELEALPPEDPLAVFVFTMCLYAGSILRGNHPGPYRDHDARAYACALLIPAELLERPAPPDIDATARWLGVPAAELRIELAAAADPARARPPDHRISRRTD